MSEAICLMEETVQVCQMPTRDVHNSRRKLNLLRQLRRELQTSAAELQAARSSYENARIGEVAAGIIAAVCDLILSIIGSLPKVPLGPATIVQLGSRAGKVLVSSATDGFKNKDAWKLLYDDLMLVAGLSLKEVGGGAGNVANVLERANRIFDLAYSLFDVDFQGGGAEGLDGAARTVSAQIGRMSREIESLETELAGCL